MLLLLALPLFVNSASIPRTEDENRDGRYKLVFFDDFNKGRLDTTVWKLIPREDNQCYRYMCNDRRLYNVANSRLRLYGKKNDNILPDDTASYLTAGVWTKGTKTVRYGKVEIRAKFKTIDGSWPALWTRSSKEDKVWPSPYYAEVDLIETPNRENIAMQAIHSYYTIGLKKTDNPNHHTRVKVDVEKYNVYCAEILPDKVIISVNGKETFRYPKIETTDIGQFPFGDDMFIIMDMQLGTTSWVPIPDEYQLPAYIDIDWVKLYELN